MVTVYVREWGELKTRRFFSRPVYVMKNGFITFTDEKGTKHYYHPSVWKVWVG